MLNLALPNLSIKNHNIIYSMFSNFICGTISYISSFFEHKKNSGEGKYTYKNGNKYDGEWKNKKMHGQGEMVYANGDKYCGNWINNMKNGKGCYIFENKYMYGSESSNPKTVRPNSTKGGICSYTGYFVDNQKYHFGIMKYKNEDEYRGNWLDNQKHGFGMMIDYDESVSIGMWDYGNLTNHKTKLPVCDICQVINEPKDLIPACGNNNCDKRICESCKNNHYNIENKSGSYVNQNIISCPFCKRVSCLYTMEINDKAIDLILGNDICGKCKYCHQYQKVERTECTEEVADAKNFICDLCQMKEGSKNCPYCHVPIEKSSGCNHMTCTRCRHEWCWVCQQRWNPSHYYCY